jgi:hypothetical protein
MHSFQHELFSKNVSSNAEMLMVITPYVGDKYLLLFHSLGFGSWLAVIIFILELSLG